MFRFSSVSRYWLFGAAAIALIAIGAGAFVVEREIRKIARFTRLESIERAKASATLEAILRDMQEARANQEKEAGARGPARTVSIGSSQAREPSVSAAVFGMIDAVNLYQKNGEVEIYGATYRPRQAGPIKLASTELGLTAGRAHLLWRPDPTRVPAATEVVLRYKVQAPSSGRLRVGLVVSGRSYVFEAKLGTAEPASASNYVPPALLKHIDSPDQLMALQTASLTTLRAELPIEIVEALQRRERGAVEAMFLDIVDTAGAVHDIAELALHQALPGPRPRAVVLSGHVEGADIGPQSEVELLSESGVVVRQNLASDGSFAFPKVPVDTPISLRFNYRGARFSGELGRWFVMQTSQAEVTIKARPRFVNVTGKPAPATGALSFGDTNPAAHDNALVPHTRLDWPGFPTLPVQEYDARTFTNNHGYLDRDRFFDNPDQCRRFVHLGSSLANSQQVPIHEKYNILMEAELGVLLGRCVEVVSAGRDNGDIGANYRRVKHYAVKFEPEAILLENSNTLLMQMQPELLRRYTGMDAKNSAFDRFLRAEGGELYFKERSANWPIHAGKPDATPLPSGIPPMLAVMVPPELMPPEAKDAYELLSGVLKHYRVEFPGTRFIMHTGLDQTICTLNGNCNNTILHEETKIPAGSNRITENLRAFCQVERLDCIHPVVGERSKRDYTLNFPHDTHYSPAGQQWFAREIGKGLMTVLDLQQVGEQ